MAIHPTNLTPANGPRPHNDLLREQFERSVAAKIVGMLPPDDESARRILGHAGVFHTQFASIAACRAIPAEG